MKTVTRLLPLVLSLSLIPGMPLPRPRQDDPRIAEYMPLVRNQARVFYRGWLAKMLGQDDLVAIGMAAVWRATLEWRETGEASFGTYVTTCVVHALMHEKKRSFAMKRAAVTNSLTREDDTQIDIDSRTATPEQIVAESQIRGLVLKLAPRHRKLIERRFFFGDTLEEVGELLSITRERVRQIEGDAIERLRKRLWSMSPKGIRRSA